MNCKLNVAIPQIYYFFFFFLTSFSRFNKSYYYETLIEIIDQWTAKEERGKSPAFFSPPPSDTGVFYVYLDLIVDVSFSHR